MLPSYGIPQAGRNKGSFEFLRDPWGKKRPDTIQPAGANVQLGTGNSKRNPRIPPQNLIHITGMRRVLPLALLCLLVPNMLAAEDLLILALYARVTPAGQVEPITDTAIESILGGASPQPSQDLQALVSKSYQISTKPRYFESKFDGVQGQRVVLSFTALVLPNGTYALMNYRISGIAKAGKNALVAPGSSEVVSRGGFTVAPGHHIPQSVTVRFEGGVVTYYLIFSGSGGGS